MYILGTRLGKHITECMCRVILYFSSSYLVIILIGNVLHLYTSIEMTCKDEASRPETCSVYAFTFVDTIGADIAVIH